MKFYQILTDEGRRKKYAWAFPVYGYPIKKIICEQCEREWNDFKSIYDEKVGFPISLTNEYFADIATCEGMTMANEKVKQLIEANNMGTVAFSEMSVVAQDELSSEKKKKLRDDGYNVKRLSNAKPKYYMLYPEIGACLHPDSNFKWIDEGEDICKHCGYGVGYKPKDYSAPYYIEQRSWNGNEVFRIKELMGSIVCTERFKDLLIENDVTGVYFEEIEAR